MTQHDYYKNMALLISNEAVDYDPIKMANALYFYIKQYPENSKIDEEWKEMLKYIKMFLSQYYEWKMRDIHQFFIKFNKLTKYMKKTI